MAAKPSVVFGGRELWPFITGGGIARTLHATLRLLAPTMAVTMITRAAFREHYEEMLAAADPRLPHPDVRFEFVNDPDGLELGPFSSFQHCWSARLYERICELYPDGGPNVAVFGDYLGEGFVTAQARHSAHASLRRTTVMIRLNTSLEMVDALDGRESADEERRAIYTLERGSLAFADELRCPTEATLAGYARYYGADRLAPGRAMPNLIVGPEATPPPTRPSPPGTRTRLLFIGRLQPLKGVVELVTAACRLKRDDWELTLLGRDTDTAPGGGSMKKHLQQLVGGNEHIVFHEQVPVEQVYKLIDGHHVVVAPSHWESWSVVAREGLARNRPVLATPRGGLRDSAEPGVSGWLTDGITADQIERGLKRVLDSRDEIEAMIASGGPARHVAELADPDTTLANYTELAARPDRSAPPPAKAEGVSAVVVCSAGAGPLARTLDSLRAQHVPVDEVVLVCDGIDRLPSGFDAGSVHILELLPREAGPSACLNAGCTAASGQLVLLLNSGTELHPQALEELLVALRHNPDAAYASAWADGLDPSAVPFGNFANFVPEDDNSAVAPLVRREVLERGHRFDTGLGSCAGRAFYARLADEGLFGCVVPRRLISSAPFSAACADVDLMARAAGPSPASPDWAG
jgi:glycogen synthase